MMLKKISAFLIISLMLSGCYDKVEIENRGFVISMGIDKFSESENKKEQSKTPSFEGDSYKDRFLVSMALPNVAALIGKAAGEQKVKTVKTASNETISAAMHTIDSYSSEKIYYGHTKVVILGAKLLEDEALFRETIDALERNREISRKGVVLASDDVIGTLEAEVSGEPMVGIYVSKFYKNNANLSAVAFKKDLETIIRELRSSNSTIIPKITSSGKDIKIGSAAVIKDFKLTGWLNDSETRGYLWLKGTAKGAQLVTEYEGNHIPLSIYKTKSKLKFSEQDNEIICQVDVAAKGTIQEFIFSDETLFDETKMQQLSQKYEQEISKEITKTYELFYKQHGIDGFFLAEEIRKKAYPIYQKHQKEDIIKKIQVVPNCHVEITSTGSIK